MIHLDFLFFYCNTIIINIKGLIVDSKKLYRLAAFGQWTSLVGIAVIIAFVIYLAVDQEAFRRFLAGQVTAPFSSAPREALLWAGVVELVPLGLFLFGMWKASRLFTLIKQQKFYTKDCQIILMRLGQIALLSSISNIIVRGVLTLILTWNNPVGERVLEFGISSTDFTSLVVAILFFVFALLQKEMVAIAEDNRSII
jgi:hypothetical protein